MPEASAQTAYGLDWLLAPVSRETFLSDYWEKQCLLVQRETPEAFSSLLSLDEIDRVITTLGMRFPDINMVNAERDLTRQDFTFGRGQIDVPKVYQLFGEGSTIILPQLHRVVPNLDAFCRALERDFSAPFQTNIYLTPGRAKGFKPHFDTHDVFVMQISGTKLWKIYQDAVHLPLVKQHFDSKVFQPQDVTMEFELKPGEVIYIPRGVMHDAIATDEVSLHITLGALNHTWVDVIRNTIEDLVLDDPEFRTSLPFGFARQDFDRAAAHAKFHDLMARLAEKADPDPALDLLADRLIATRNPMLRGQMAQISALERLDGDSRVSPRPFVIHHMREETDTGKIALSCYGKTITLPHEVKESLRFALETQAYQVKDLPGALDLESKLVLIKRLIREGLVQQEL